MKESRILIVDDQESNVLLLQRILRSAGYTNYEATMDSRRVLSLYTEFQPDILLLDLHMPHWCGLSIMRQLQIRFPQDTYFPILVLTADITAAAKRSAFEMGARDFLTKPFDPTEVLLRVTNLLETRLLHLQLRNQNQILEQKVRERTRELEEAQLEILKRLGVAAEYRDDATGEHTERVSQTAALLARAVDLPEDQIELIRQAALLHDVGKIGIPDSILLKPGKLTAEEFEVMKTHTSIGAKILSQSRFSLLQLAEQIALYHHERWDGTGYARVEGPTIPLAARIVALADVFDALTHERPYKKAWSVEEALAEIERQGGRQFDPSLAKAFLQLLRPANLLNLETAIQAESPETLSPTSFPEVVRT